MSPSEDDKPITALEQSVGARLASHVSGACLKPDALVELAVLGQKSAQYQAGMDHIVTCSSCRDLLRRFQTMESLEAARGNRSLSSAKTDGADGTGSRSRKPFAILGPRLWMAAGGTVAMAAILLLMLLPRRTIVSLQDNGGQIQLSAAGDLSGLPGLPSTQAQAVAAVLRSGRVPPAAVLASLRTASPASSEAFTITGPRSTVIEALKPEFTWKMPVGAISCRITLKDETNAAHTVRSKPVKTEKWTPKKPLVHGDTYAWNVVALNSKGQVMAYVPFNAGTAKFKVLASDRSKQLEKQRISLGHSHLAMGAIYAQEGMLDDAEREFTALRSANPDSVVAKSLLESVLKLRA